MAAAVGSCLLLLHLHALCQTYVCCLQASDVKEAADYVAQVPCLYSC